MLRLLTDGAIDVPDGWEREYDIKVIPINIHFGEKTYIQNVDMDLPAFYKEIETNKNHPKTSQPSPHQFVEFIRANYAKGDAILGVHVTSKLSGTYASAVAAAEELKGEYNFVPFDSLAGSVGGAFMCRAAYNMAKAGKTVEQIVGQLEAARAKTLILLTLDNLEFAKR
ncbi:MAG: DegV family protein, partial [Chloroflexota bacterium]